MQYQLWNRGAARLRRALHLYLTCAATLGAQASAGSDACGGVRPRSGTLGVGEFQCASGCVVNEHGPRGYAHHFGTEPSVWQLDAGGPAAGVLRDGDVIVAIDGALSTTAEGGKRLANLVASRPIVLRIRRGGVESVHTLTPVLGCNIPALWVHGIPANDVGRTTAPASDVRVSYGLQLDCGDCGWRRNGAGDMAWFGGNPPLVVAVTADGPGATAGVRAGDVLESLNGVSFVAPEGSTALARFPAGQPIALRVKRGGVLVSLQITPSAVAGHARPFN